MKQTGAGPLFGGFGVENEGKAGDWAENEAEGGAALTAGAENGLDGGGQVKETGEEWESGEGAAGGFPAGRLPLVEPERPPVDLEEVERRDRENTIRTLELKAARGTPLKPGEKKELRRLLAIEEGRRLAGSLEELAEALGVSLRTVKYWAAEPGFPVGEDELYDVEAVAEWRAARGNGNGHRMPGAFSSSPEDEEEDESGKDWIKVKDEYAARRERLKYETEKGRLISKTDVERLFAERAQALSSGLLALAKLLSPLFFDGQTPQEREEIIDKHARALLNHYTRPLPENLFRNGG